MINYSDNNKIYQRDVSKQQETLPPELEAQILKSLQEERSNLVELILSNETTRNILYEMLSSIKSDGLLARCASNFKSYVAGHNKKVVSKIKEALAIASISKDEEIIKESYKRANLSYSTYETVLSKVDKHKSKFLLDAGNNIKDKISELEHRLIQGSLKTAYDVAVSYNPNVLGLDVMDAIQEANYGLLIAARNYDPSRAVGPNKTEFNTKRKYHTKFDTYARHCAEDRVKEWMMESSRLVRIPKPKLKQVFMVLKAGRQLKREKWDIPTVHRLVNEHITERNEKKATKNPLLSVEDISEILLILQASTVPLDSTPDNDDDFGTKTRTIADLLADNAPGAENVFNRGECIDQIHNSLRTILTLDEQSVIYARYFSDPSRSVPYEVVRKQMSDKRNYEIQIGWIRSVEKRALTKIKRTFPELQNILLNGDLD